MTTISRQSVNYIPITEFIRYFDVVYSLIVHYVRVFVLHVYTIRCYKKHLKKLFEILHE